MVDVNDPVVVVGDNPLELLRPHAQRPSDLGNAERLVRDHGAELRYCFPLRAWFVWDGRRWARDDTGEVSRRAKATVRRLLIEAAELPDPKPLATWALTSEQSGRIASMVDLARSESIIPVRPGEWDADLWILNVLNGTVDLRTGELRPHRRADLITKLAPVAYDLEAECPRWQAFLRWAMGGDEEMVGFLQRAVGLSLSGSTDAQVMFILHGGGDNGKSLFLKAIRQLLGDYATTVRIEALLTTDRSTISNDIADLAGARFVTTSEVEQGRYLAEAKFKELTGGDRIKARRLNENLIEFDPQWKLWLATNHLPKISGTDHAVWRRVLRVWFGVKITEGKRPMDGMLAEFAEEASGILRWSVEGCLDYQGEGLRPPQKVVAATADYRAESDIVGKFLEERCVVDEGLQAKGSDLYLTYKQWAGSNGLRPLGNPMFARQLEERGFSRGSGRQRYTWFGLSLGVGS